MSDYVDQVYTKRLIFPDKQVLDALDYSLNLADPTFPVLPPGDTLSTLTVTVKPSGTGELTPLRCYAIDSVITAWLDLGVAGRDYLIRYLATTSQGRTFDLIAELSMSALLEITPIPAAPSDDWSTSVYWQSDRLDFSIPSNSAYYPVIL